MPFCRQKPVCAWKCMWWGLACLQMKVEGRGWWGTTAQAPYPWTQWGPGAALPLQVIQARAMVISGVTDGVQRALLWIFQIFCDPWYHCGIPDGVLWQWWNSSNNRSHHISSLLGRLQFRDQMWFRNLKEQGIFCAYVCGIHTHYE